ncbi:nucleolin-like [Calliphora vicina]|uniref:nucleolin-like n=1 Tax=Calliphora vicina TaxID=7373 RepID=UPI00325BC7DB
MKFKDDDEEDFSASESEYAPRLSKKSSLEDVVDSDNYESSDHHLEDSDEEPQFCSGDDDGDTVTAAWQSRASNILLISCYMVHDQAEPPSNNMVRNMMCAANRKAFRYHLLVNDEDSDDDNDEEYYNNDDEDNYDNEDYDNWDICGEFDNAE